MSMTESSWQSIPIALLSMKEICAINFSSIPRLSKELRREQNAMVEALVVMNEKSLTASSV